MIPEQCDIPNLSDIDPLKGRLILRLFAFGDKGLNQKSGVYRKIFVRLVDKAVYEYQQARDAVVAQVEERNRPAEEMIKKGRIIYIFGFTDHLENCVNAVRRLLRLLDRLKAGQGAPHIPRLQRRSIEAHSQLITDVRDAIEHMDEKIHNDELKEGVPIALTITDDGKSVQIGDASVTFNDLSLLIRRMHEIATHLIENPSTSQAVVEADESNLSS